MLRNSCNINNRRIKYYAYIYTDNIFDHLCTHRLGKLHIMRWRGLYGPICVNVFESSQY